MNHYRWGHDKKMGLTEKLAIWLVVICGIACATPIIGWFGLFTATVVDQYQNQELPHVATFEEKEFLGSEIDRLQKAAIDDPDYFAFEFVRDRIYLVELMDRYNLRQTHDGCIKSLYELSTKTVKEARENNNDRLFLMQDHKWRNEFMDAEVELGVITVGDKEVLRGIKKISLTLLLWYLKFIPFAFIILLVRLKFDDRFKIKEELLLDCKKPILWSIFWPVGFVYYPDTQTAVYFRYLKLKSIYQATKGYDWNYQFSEQEEAKLQAQALQRITNFDQVVADQSVRTPLFLFKKIVYNIQATAMKKYVTKPLKSDNNLKIDYQSELNDEQYRAVTQSDGPSLVLAGAGSGKTRTLVYRVAYLIENGIKPDRIMLVTFTNKAASEMLTRVEQLLKYHPKGLWGGTFHSIGNRILRMYGKNIGIESNFNILDEEDSKALIKSAISELNITKDKFFPKADTIKKVVSLSANLNKSVAQTIIERFSHLEEYSETLQTIDKAYKQKKIDNNSLDFDDLLYKWNELLASNHNIRDKLSTKFQHVLVDEYQDTNFIQGEIIKNLGGNTNNILAVGDDSQSIYSFRGATVKNILNFPKTFDNAKMFRLETNYRSTPEILELANFSIKNNLDQFEKKLRTTKASAETPKLLSVYDNYQQAEFICQRILELSEENDYSLDDFAILFRAHYLSLELEMELNKRNIPYQMRGGLRFFEQAHIKDVVSFLKALSATNDEVSWTRILQMQPGIGAAGAKKIFQKISKHKDTQTAISGGISESLSGKNYTGYQNVRGLLLKMIGIDNKDVSSLIQQVLDSNYSQYLKAAYENPQDRKDDLDQLAIFASKYNSLEEFLSDIALSEGFKGDSIAASPQDKPEAVTLSTIHQAKGLEWKTVFVIGLAEGQFPHSKTYEKPEQVEEERRLFYVAVTRAEQHLYMIVPTVIGRGDIIARPSQFIKELPEGVYEHWSAEEDKNLTVKSFRDDEVTYTDESDNEWRNESILDKYL